MVWLRLQCRGGGGRRQAGALSRACPAFDPKQALGFGRSSVLLPPILPAEPDLEGADAVGAEKAALKARVWRIFRFPGSDFGRKAASRRHDAIKRTASGPLKNCPPGQTQSQINGIPSRCDLWAPCFGPNPDDRTSGQPWTTPITDVLSRATPQTHNAPRNEDFDSDRAFLPTARISSGCRAVEQTQLRVKRNTHSWELHNPFGVLVRGLP